MSMTLLPDVALQKDEYDAVRLLADTLAFACV